MQTFQEKRLFIIYGYHSKKFLLNSVDRFGSVILKQKQIFCEFYCKILCNVGQMNQFFHFWKLTFQEFQGFLGTPQTCAFSLTITYFGLFSLYILLFKFTLRHGVYAFFAYVHSGNWLKEFAKHGQQTTEMFRLFHSFLLGQLYFDFLFAYGQITDAVRTARKDQTNMLAQWAIYRVEHQTLPVRFLCDSYGMLQDIYLKFLYRNSSDIYLMIIWRKSFRLSVLSTAI